MIKSFDKQNLKLLRTDINGALKQVADKHGISLGIGNITFDIDGQRFTTRITANTKRTIVSSDTCKANPLMFTQAGFKIGDSFRHNTKLLTVVGYNPKKPKNCVELTDQNGKKFGAPLTLVQSKIGIVSL